MDLEDGTFLRSRLDRPGRALPGVMYGLPVPILDVVLLAVLIALYDTSLGG